MDKNFAVEKSLALIKNSKIAMLGTIDHQGYPNIKAMLNLDTEGMTAMWFSTNTSSQRVAALLKDSKACVYYVDQENFMGLMLVGEIEVLQDEESRKRLWFEGAERYYQQGVNDPDYCVLRFKAERGNFYHRLENIDFVVE